MNLTEMNLLLRAAKQPGSDPANILSAYGLEVKDVSMICVDEALRRNWRVPEASIHMAHGITMGLVIANAAK